MRVARSDIILRRLCSIPRWLIIVLLFAGAAAHAERLLVCGWDEVFLIDASAAGKGGSVEKESPISAANVKLICAKCDKPTSIARKAQGDGARVRVCKACDATLE